MTRNVKVSLGMRKCHLDCETVTLNVKLSLGMWKCHLQYETAPCGMWNTCHLECETLGMCHSESVTWNMKQGHVECAAVSLGIETVACETVTLINHCHMESAAMDGSVMWKVQQCHMECETEPCSNLSTT